MIVEVIKGVYGIVVKHESPKAVLTRIAEEWTRLQEFWKSYWR
jgi:hypothetical protein